MKAALVFTLSLSTSVVVVVVAVVMVLVVVASPPVMMVPTVVTVSPVVVVVLREHTDPAGQYEHEREKSGAEFLHLRLLLLVV